MKKVWNFFNREQNLLIHIIAATIAIIMSFLLKISGEEWLFVLGVISLVITSELINSAIELTVDLYISSYNPLAKIAKDTAAAAVVVSAVTALFIGLYIFLPKVLYLIF